MCANIFWSRDTCETKFRAMFRIRVIPAHKFSYLSILLVTGCASWNRTTILDVIGVRGPFNWGAEAIFPDFLCHPNVQIESFFIKLNGGLPVSQPYPLYSISKTSFSTPSAIKLRLMKTYSWRLMSIEYKIQNTIWWLCLKTRISCPKNARYTEF